MALWGAPDESVTQYRSIIDAVRDGVFVIDLDGTTTYANDSLCTLLDRERNELTGATFETLVESELIGSEQYDRFVARIEDLAGGGTADQILSFEIGEGNEQVVDVRIYKHSRDDGTEDIVGVVRDVTERERRVEAVERKQAMLAQLYEIGADASLTFEEKTQRILGIGCEFLDLPFGFLTRIDEGVQQIVHAVGDHELLQPGESAPLERSYCRKTIESEDLVGMQDARKEVLPRLTPPSTRRHSQSNHGPAPKQSHRLPEGFAVNSTDALVAHGWAHVIG